MNTTTLWDQADEALKAISGFLTAGRSCAIAVINDTDSVLTMDQTSEKLDHGGYVQEKLPAASIAPRSTIVFGAQSGDDTIATGAEGHLTYACDAFAFSIHWDDPWAGGNSCDAAVDDTVNYATNAENSVGNRDATYRFLVSQLQPQSQPQCASAGDPSPAESA